MITNLKNGNGSLKFKKKKRVVIYMIRLDILWLCGMVMWYIWLCGIYIMVMWKFTWFVIFGGRRWRRWVRRVMGRWFQEKAKFVALPPEKNLWRKTIVEINWFIFFIIVGNHSFIVCNGNQLSCKNLNECVQHWLSITNVPGSKNVWMLSKIGYRESMLLERLCGC